MTNADTTNDLAVIAERQRKNLQTDEQALTELVFDNADLERLESLLDEFNIFEAIGMVRQEIRHSAFLAFLLDPRQTHGLGDTLLRRFLQRVVANAPAAQIPINVIDLDVWNLDETQVLREWEDIDVLLLNEANKLAIIIENKIDSGEHSEQLERYYATVSGRYPDWNLFGIYLSPLGTPPSGNDSSHKHYLAVSHQMVVELIEDVITARASTLGPDVRTLLLHYAQMMRRYIVSGSEIDVLCSRIYEKHKRAIELIFKHRPNKQALLQTEMKTLIETAPGIRLRYATGQQVGFHPKEWDNPVLQRGAGEKVPALTLEFYLYNNDYNVKIGLYAQWGTKEHRRKLVDMAGAKNPPLTGAKNPPLHAANKKLGQAANLIYSRVWLSRQDLDTLETTALITKLHKQWAGFVDVDLERIKEIVRGEEWIWADTYVPTGDEISDTDGQATPDEGTSDEVEQTISLR